MAAPRSLIARFEANDCSSGLWNRGVGSAGAKAPSASGADALGITLVVTTGSFVTSAVVDSPSCTLGSSG